jgi:dipeptidyl aminopeptidase/acylaminoacyl peptidase
MAVAGWRAHYDPATVKPVEAIRKIKVPILLMHGDQDEVVSYKHAELLKRAAGGPVTWHPLKSAGHNSPRMGDYQKTIADFLTKYVGR